MLSSLVVPLPGRIFLVLLLQLSLWVSDSFLVVGPSEPIVAMLGAEAVLPCFVDPAMSVESMELRWYRSQFSEAVYVYQGGMEQTGQQLAAFKRRTELVKDHMSEGKVAVKIYHLRVSDNGMYRCFIRKDSDFEEATLELRVIGLGFGPHVLIVGPEDTGIKLTCTGKGWFPKPEMQWRDAQGEKMLSLSEDETQGEDGLFQVEASLVITDSSKNKVSCSMKNPFLGQEQVKTISVPEPFFRRDPYQYSLALGLVSSFLVIFLIAAVVWAWCEKQRKRSLRKAKEDEMKELRAKESLKKEPGGYSLSMKTSYQHVVISLALRTPNSNLILSENRRSISLRENIVQNLDDLPFPPDEETQRKISALGHNFFTRGKYYWEVQLTTEGDETTCRWDVGVYSKRVKKPGGFLKIPNQFFLLALKKDEIWAQINPPKFLFLKQPPHRIGLFLDCEAGVLSFYNMDKDSHIFSFVGITIHGALRPFFSLQGPDTSLSICSAPDHVENHPESSSKGATINVEDCNLDVPEEETPFLPLKK